MLAVRHDWAESEPETAKRLIRTLWRAAKWLSNPANRMTASEILARRDYLDAPAEIILEADIEDAEAEADGE